MVQYTQYTGNSFSTFRGNKSAPPSRQKNSWPLKIWPIGCPETSVKNYHYTLCNIPGECSSYVLHSGSLESHRFNVIVTFFVYQVRTDWWQVSLCLTLLMSRPQIPTIRYKSTVPTCRITAVSYLPPPLTFLLQSYTQVFRSAGTVSDPVWRVLLAVSASQFGLSILNKSDIIHRIDLGKFLPFPACSGLC